MEGWIRAEYIVAYSGGGHKILKNGFMKIENGRIADVRRALDPSVPFLDLGNKTICPGFINLHCHGDAPMSKSFMEDAGNPFLYQSTMYDHAMIQRYDAEAADAAFRLTLSELLLNGCTTIVDSGSGFSPRFARTAGEFGIRAYVGACYRSGLFYTKDGRTVEYPYDDAAGAAQMERAVADLKEFDGAFGGRIKMILAPTQTTTCTPEILEMTRKEADRLGVLITIHAAELAVEFQECVRRYGKTPVGYLKSTGLLEPDVIVGHCILISGHSAVNYPGGGDMELLSESGATVAHSPWVFARRGIALESYPDYLKHGINVGLGTDTFPADYFREMRCACAVGKLLKRDCFAATAADVFNSATLCGAKALGRTDIGRLSPGAKADFLVFDNETSEMSPLRDPIRNIVYSATRDSIESVYIDGQLAADKGKIPGRNNREDARLVQAAAEKMWANAPDYDWKKRNADELSPQTFPEF